MLEMPQLKKPSYLFQRIAFLGPMACGKTWCANYLVENYGYNKLAFADKLKALAYDLYGIQSKDGPNRAILQELGGVDLRKHDPDVWIKHALYRAQHLEETVKQCKLVLDDLRYPNEAKILEENGFVLVIAICDENLRQKRIKHLYPDYPESVQNHVSELGWMEMRPYYQIVSNGYEAMTQLDEMLEAHQTLFK